MSVTVRISEDAHKTLLQLAAEMTVATQGAQRFTAADALDALIQTQLDKDAREEIVRPMQEV
ncbi:hypothetical protein GCM10022394_35410 [Zobellella aerophila]|uniref:CopG family transcriptional regulator n=1 Tax=Zobellella aerophila TaxID=870480 RepID=A0ABP6WI93_9GAMM